MGLLEDLIGGLAGQAMGGRPAQQQQPTRADAGGMDMSRILVALMPVVLAMLANRGRQSGTESQAGVRPGTSGGGLGGLLEQLQRAGFREQADSWVSRGRNQPIPPDAMGQVFGRDGIEEIARRAGLSTADASRGMAELLPEVVDRVTPNGETPDFDSLTNSVQDLARRFGLS